jgi:hypothetical protein
MTKQAYAGDPRLSNVDLDAVRFGFDHAVLMALAGVWTGILIMVCELGLGAAVVQFRDLQEGELNFCFALTMATSCAAYGLLFAAAPAIASWFASPALASILRVAGLILPLEALHLVHDGLLRKRLGRLRLENVVRHEKQEWIVKFTFGGQGRDSVSLVVIGVLY